MNRHNSYQQPEATANNANAKQWQIDVPKQGASKVGNYGNASDVNGGKNANDTNRTSDQGEIIEVRLIKDDRDEPNNDEPGQVEQGGQAGQAVQTDTEAQPKKRGIIELLGSSPLGIVAQTALDSVRHIVHEIQVDRQIKLINRTVNHYDGDEARRDHNQLNQLVEDGKLDLSNELVLRSYMREVRSAMSDEAAESDSKFISKMLQEGKINLSDPKIAKEFLDTREYYNNRYLGIQEALGLGKLDLSNEDIRCQFLDSLDDVKADGGRAMVDLLGKMKGENGKYDAEAVEQFSRFMGNLCINHLSELFDDDKLTDKFYSASFKQYYHNKGIDRFMPYIDDGWKNHYGDTGRKYLELVSTYPDHKDSKYERTQWIRDYFDAGGPTGELFDAILCDNSDDFSNVEVCLDDPDIYSKLSNGQKDFISIYKRYGSDTNNEISSNISKGRANIVQGTLTVDSLVNEILNEIPLNADKIDLLGDCQDAASRLLNSNEKSLAKFCVDYKGYEGYQNVLLSMSMVNNHNLADYFDANGPTDKMKDKILFEKASFLYDHPELQEGLSAEQKNMVKFCGEYDFTNLAVEEYGVTADNLSEYFDANGPTLKLKEKVLFSNVSSLFDHPELQEGLSDTEKSLVKFCEQCDIDSLRTNKYCLYAHYLTRYFNADGPKPVFWQSLFTDGAYDVIYKYSQNQDEAGRKRMGLDDKQIAVAKGYCSISEGDDWNDSRKLFESYVREHYDELTAEQIRQVSGIIVRLSGSNASELSERSEAFAGELLKLDADKIPEALDKIEDVYIHNHLPYVGKNYLVFRTMHPSDNLEEDFNFSPLSYGRPNTISPALQQATGDLKSGKLDQMLNSRDTIIISDLLRASLGSNNRSIREYLTTLKNGQTLLDQLSSGELDWSTFNQPTNLMDKDTKASYDTLSTFAWHLATIYNSTLPGKEHPYQLIHQQADQDVNNALQADFTNLTSLIKPNSRYTLADRAVRYFAHFVGIEDLAGAERYMDNVVKEADARNRRTAEYLATTSEPKLQPGDLVKGMGGTDGYGIRYLSYAFQNGSISKEYLGDSSRSDTTPLDVDLSVVLNYPGDTRTIDHAMRPMLADDYGCGLWTVLRSDEATGEDRFIITRRDSHEADQSVYDLSVPDANFDRTNLSKEEIDRRLREIAEAKRHRREGLPKLEAFATGRDGDGHYGIRTGFGMDKVSYYISDRTFRTGKI